MDPIDPRAGKPSSKLAAEVTTIFWAVCAVQKQGNRRLKDASAFAARLRFEHAIKRTFLDWERGELARIPGALFNSVSWYPVAKLHQPAPRVKPLSVGGRSV